MVDPLAAFTHNLLRYGNTHAIAEAADAAPGDAVLNAYAASATMFGMTPAGRIAAAPYLARAHAAAASANERLLAAAISAWAAGDEARAIALHRERLRLRPDDLAALKLCQLHHINLGDFTGMLETIRAIAPHHPGNHYVLGQLAFALEETDHIAEARETATRAVSLAAAAGADDPWSVHALAHVHHHAGDLRASIALVHDHAALWERCGTFMGVHAWWHAAIAELDLDRAGAALALYDAWLAPADPECVQSLVARIALLARLHLREVDVGDRWHPLRDAMAERAGDGVNGFLDVHYLYGLALAGEGAQAREAAERIDGPAADAARAMIADREGDPARAAKALGRMGASLHRLGGSHEQRELYELVELHAALAAGRGGQARAILSHRLETRPAWQKRLIVDGRAAPVMASVGAGD